MKSEAPTQREQQPKQASKHASSLVSLSARPQSTPLPVITTANSPHRRCAKSISTCNFYPALFLPLSRIWGQIKTRQTDQREQTGLQMDFSKYLHFSKWALSFNIGKVNNRAKYGKTINCRTYKHDCLWILTLNEVSWLQLHLHSIIAAIRLPRWRRLNLNLQPSHFISSPSVLLWNRRYPRFSPVNLLQLAWI